VRAMNCELVESWGHRHRTYGAAVLAAIRSEPRAILGRVNAVCLAKGADEAAPTRVPNLVRDLAHR
jgi:hypothetical protein